MRVILINEKRLEELVTASCEHLKLRAFEMQCRCPSPLIQQLACDAEIELHNLRRKIVEADVLRL